MAENLDIKIAEQDGTTLLTVAGRLDGLTAPSLEEALLDRARRGESLCVDLSRVSYVSSAGLRVLLAAAKELRRQGRGLELRKPSDDVYNVLKLSGFTTLMTITGR
jgi:anti-anti-sigma factor